MYDHKNEDNIYKSVQALPPLSELFYCPVIGGDEEEDGEHHCPESY